MKRPLTCEDFEEILGGLGYSFAGFDYNGHAWLWDVEHLRLFVSGDENYASLRGYHCPSEEEAVRRVKDGEVP